jgi:hypothetical protein
MNRSLVKLALGCAALALGAIAQADTTNRPPGKAFSAYSGFELLPITLDEADARDKGRVEAAAKVQEHFNEIIGPIVADWNSRKPAAEGAPHLVIEPRIDTIRKVSLGSRVFFGPYGGNSFVVMHLRFFEQPGNTLFAEPEFYQHTAALSGSFTNGGQDKDMLRRIAVVVADYLKANFDNAIGGRTGRDE